jgi:hypothetical protein
MSVIKARWMCVGGGSRAFRLLTTSKCVFPRFPLPALDKRAVCKSGGNDQNHSDRLSSK